MEIPDTFEGGVKLGAEAARRLGWRLYVVMIRGAWQGARHGAAAGALTAVVAALAADRARRERDGRVH